MIVYTHIFPYHNIIEPERSATMKYTAITGASSGIGYAAAKAFAARGSNVIVIARRTEKLKILKEEIRKDHPETNVVIRPCDLSSDSEVIRLYEDLKKYDIETWVNDAGIGNAGDLKDAEIIHNLNMLHVNVIACAMLSALFVQDHMDDPGAQLINVSSTAGYTMFTGCALYGATKAMVASMTEEMDREMKDGGHCLRCKVLAPSVTETEFVQTAHEMDKNIDYRKVFKEYNTAAELADFMLQLHDSDRTVGIIEEGKLVLCDAKFPRG